MRQLGLSLVELMVAIAIASFIALAATSYYAAMFSASNAVRNTASAQAHSFYTGTQKIIDTGGRVQKFEERFGKKK
jgi:ribosomal protein L31